MLPMPRTVTDNVIDKKHHLTCEVCGNEFISRRRDARHCDPACTQRAYRLRHQQVSEAPALAKRLPKDCKIYQCPKCDTRYLGEQRCPDCGVFCRLLGPGGECPHCGEPVAVHDLGLQA
jgi:hypothetical protein